MADRPFISTIYPRLATNKYQSILDVGARGYNRNCKGLLNSTTSTKYFQVEPFPPDVMNNDGLLKCIVQDIPVLYPQYQNFFDVVLDFGVFGWGDVHVFNTTAEMMEDVRRYTDALLFVLRPGGLWILKIDKGWVPNEDEIFRDYILPHFDAGNLDELKSGMQVKRKQFRFYYFYRKENSTIKPTIDEKATGSESGSVQITGGKADSTMTASKTTQTQAQSQTDGSTVLTHSRNYTAQKGWIYEPKNVDYFWKKMADRPFISTIYPRLATNKYQSILDVGARGYNRNCKGLLNSTTSTKYFQVEPFPPDVMNNDGLLKCIVQDIPVLYPQYQNFFDVVLDFGVFGWGDVHVFNTTAEMMEDVRRYTDALLFVLRPGGLWILKIDKGWVPNEDEIFRDYILPHFDAGNLDELKSGMQVREYRFYYFYRKENSTIKPTIEEDSTEPGDAGASRSLHVREVLPSFEMEKAKNPIQAENELPGTPDWILSKPAKNREIEGYMSLTSIQKGESILLFHNTRAPTVTIDVFRTGWYTGVGARKLAGPVTVSGVVQVVPLPTPEGTVACQWTDPYVVQTLDSWTTGVYLVRMTEMLSETQSYAIFVLRDDDRVETRPDIMFQLPVNTYQAYNYWGGKSLYGWGSGGPNKLPWGYKSRSRGGVKVSFDRPYACSNNPDAAYGNGAGEYLTNIQPIHHYPISSSAAWNYNMVRWLERNGIDISYVTNVDVHTRFDHLVKPRLFLTQGHDEYWSWEMRDNVESWRDDGVNLAFLGSNTAFMQVRFEEGQNGGGIISNGNSSTEPRILVCFRFPWKDPLKNDPDKKHLVSAEWHKVRPEGDMVGVEYIGDPFDTDLVVADASHWIFNGTGLSSGDKLPGMLGYEVDVIPRKQKRKVTTLFATPVITRMNTSLVCHGTMYQAPSGAFVFASGTMQWSWGLDDYNVDQGLRSSRLHRAVEVMTWNMLKAAGIRSGAANSIKADPS